MVGWPAVDDEMLWHRTEVNHPLVRWVCGELGLWVECHTEEFCMKVLKFEIMNSRKLFIYFSRGVPRTIEFVQKGR